MSANKPDQNVEHQDFVRGWPHPSLLERKELRDGLIASYTKSILDYSSSALNYGTADDGAYILGHTVFREGLARFLTTMYGREASSQEFMSTCGASMGIDLCCRTFATVGDYVICEKPTFYLAHQIFQERGLNLREVDIQSDGINLDALESAVIGLNGKCKLVYTIPIHHNPTGVTMIAEKRVRLAQMARKYQFHVIADEAYQLLNFRKNSPIVAPLFYEDDPADPRILSVSTFSKLVGPGLKIGWIQANKALLAQLGNVGFVAAGNNPVTFSSTGLVQFLDSGAMAEHITYVSGELARKCALLCRELRSAGYSLVEPSGGYFVWVHSANKKMTGRSGAGMALDPPNQFAEHMRLCFAWLDDEQIVQGISVLK